MSRIEKVEPTCVGTHSLRIGGATALYQFTKDAETVRRFGRWTPGSPMVFLYSWYIVPTSTSTTRGMSQVDFELSDAAAVHHQSAGDRRPWRGH